MTDDIPEDLFELPTKYTDDGDEVDLLADRFKIIRKLGEGGMGIVYLAEDTKLENEYVAIKLLNPILSGNKRAIKNLRKEVQTTRRLTHPNIVRLHDLHTDGDMNFVVMEYIEGKTLEEYLDDTKETKLSVEALLPIAEQIAAGLSYAHSEKILHRDLKPGNIMITSDGKAKILDFGIAREMKDSYVLVSGKETSGTLPYMSPQQLLGEPATSPMDIYSFGAVLYECLTGKPPFHTGDIREQIKIKTPEKMPGIPDDINQVILKSLEKEPENRFESVNTFINELLGNADHGISPKRKRKTKQPAPCASGSSGSKKLLWAKILIVLIAALVTIDVLYLGIIPETLETFIGSKTSPTEKTNIEIPTVVPVPTTELLQDNVKPTVKENLKPPDEATKAPPKSSNQTTSVRRDSYRNHVSQKNSRFIKYKNNIILDKQTNREWYTGPDKNTSENSAYAFLNQKNHEKFAGGNWKFPTPWQISSLSQKGIGKYNLDPIFGVNTGCEKLYVWKLQSEKSRTLVRATFVGKKKAWGLPSARSVNDDSLNARVFLVRAR